MQQNMVFTSTKGLCLPSCTQEALTAAPEAWQAVKGGVLMSRAVPEGHSPRRP